MIILRSDEEIAGIRDAGKIVAMTLEKLKKYARPGTTTEELDRIARDQILKQDATPAFKRDYDGVTIEFVRLNQALARLVS